MNKLISRALFNPNSVKFHQTRQRIEDRSLGVHTYPGDWTDYSESSKRNKSDDDLSKLQTRESETNNMLEYTLRGSLYADEMPIRLEESIFARDDVEAKAIGRRKAKQYGDVEGYGVNLFIFDNSGKQIGSTSVKAKLIRHKI